jgi:glutamate/tyrosine decarboxylase-like PLP-dependent enzyme
MLRRNWLKASALATVAASLPGRSSAASHAKGADVTVGSKNYQDVVRRIRDTFPSPVKSPTADSRFSRLMAYALGQIEQRKNHRTFMGVRQPLDYAGAKQARMPQGLGDAKATIRDTAGYLEGMFTWSHPDVHRLHGAATSVSIIGQLYGSVVDPNTVWDDLSHRVAEAEVRVIAMSSELVGYDPAVASGLFTFGGTGTTFYGIKIGVETAQPQAFQQGVRDRMRIFASDVAHYAKLTSAGWLGLGSDAVESIPTTADNAIDVARLEQALRAAIQRGEKIAAIVVTMGTTDSFGIDDIQAVHALRDRLVTEYQLGYVPHLHADAVIGWSYCVFNDYDFAANPLEIPLAAAGALERMRERLQHLHLADSLGIDFHKSGYTPYMSSLFLVKDAKQLSTIRRDKAAMPYLFQFGEYDPGVYTLECSRSGGPVLAAMANLNMLGRDGFRALLSHCVEMSQLLKRRAVALPWLAVVNGENEGAVVVLRVYPDGVDAKRSYPRERDEAEQRTQLLRINTFNKKVYEATREAAEHGDSPVFVETTRYRFTSYGEPIVGVKCFTISAFTDPAAIDNAIRALDRARRKVLAQSV